jgi:serine/threonine protein kinase
MFGFFISGLEGLGGWWDTWVSVFRNDRIYSVIANFIYATGRYELRDEVGRGAMGVVYHAFDRETQRAVALKALHGADPDDLYRLRTSFARAGGGASAPGPTYEMSIEAGAASTMELIEPARTLRVRRSLTRGLQRRRERPGSLHAAADPSRSQAL